MTVKRKTTPRGPALVEVHNTGPDPLMMDSLGRSIPGNSSARVDPTDSYTAGLIESGALIVKED